MNKTVAKSLAEGIANAEAFVNHPRGEAVCLGQYGILEQHRTLVGPNGEALSPATPARRAKDEAFAQGMIAAFRAATEF